MDDKRLAGIFEEILRVDNEVHFNTTEYNLDAFTEVFKKVNTRTNPNSLSVNEALVIMLQVVHSFKYEIDMYYDNIDGSDSDYMNKEIEDIINNRITESKKEPYRLTPINLTTLLLMVLYEINGAH